MSKPIVCQPKNKEVWPHAFLVVQGVHANPATLTACMQKHGCADIAGKQLPGQGKQWIFLFTNLADGDYALHVQDTRDGKESDPLSITVKHRLFGVPTFTYPANNGASVNQGFSAFGQSDQAGGDLVGAQTMIGNNGNGAQTNGFISLEPSQSGPFDLWVVQFNVADNPLQNPYTLTITNHSGPASRTGLVLTAGPMPLP